MAAKKRARSEKTPFGTVNADVLDDMWESFDTMQILDAVGLADSIGRRTGYNEESIRNDLRQARPRRRRGLGRRRR